MNDLMVSVSGIRGIVGNGLTPVTIEKYLKAFHHIIKGKKVVIGRDTRVTGKMISAFVSSYMNFLGYDVIDLGVASTPTVEMNVTRFEADCGIIITASHNPAQWNALKLLNNRGEFLNSDEVERLKEYAEENIEIEYSNYSTIGKIDKVDDANSYHIDKIFNLKYINKEQIKKLKLKVAIDTVNGVGKGILNELFSGLGFDVVEVNSEPTGIFERGAEPTPENLKDLSNLIVENSCDVGFALDPDGDRLAIVDENGKPIGEEYTLALVADFLLSKISGTVTTNLSSSMVLDDVAKKYGVSCQRSKVGEINVSTLMKENESVIGGEGNGGVILPELHYGRDAIVGIVLLLQFMVETKKSISQLRSQYKDYYILKEKFNLGNLDKILLLDKFENSYSKLKIDKQDGVKVIGDKFWIHLRASNTEPIMRIMIESEDKEFNLQKYNEVKELLGV